MPVGLLGGTFDPPHLGHLLLGECAREQLALDSVRFLPAGDPWWKAETEHDVTPAAHRLAMTRLAIADSPHFLLDDREIARDGPTYTVDTLRELHAEGVDDLMLILGGDALAGMASWREPDAIRSLARLAVAPVEGADGAGDVETLSDHDGAVIVVEMPPLAVRSTLVREQARAGKPLDSLVPAAVAEYIRHHDLYR